MADNYCITFICKHLFHKTNDVAVVIIIFIIVYILMNCSVFIES